MAPLESLKGQLSDMIDAKWHLVAPCEVHPEWPSTPPIDKEKRAFAARFFFLPITLPISEDGMLWRFLTQTQCLASRP